MKKLFSVFLTASLLLSTAPSVFGAEDAPAALQTSEIQAVHYSEVYSDYLENPDAYTGGIIPAPFEPVIDNTAAVMIMAADELPAVYDPRDKTNEAYLSLPAVRDQGAEGDCWAFGATAAYEISNLKSGTVAAYDNTNILSESHMAASLYNQPGDPWTFSFIEGGNRQMSTAYYARGSGPVLDSVYPQKKYQDKELTHTDAIKLTQSEQVQNILYVTDSTEVTEDDRHAIKQAIKTFGAVSTSYYSAENNSTYYNSQTGAFYYNGPENSTNHGISLVGWDDTYEISNFGGQKPAKPGAWIMRNSWGDKRGIGGYEYVSYYDKHMGKSATAYIGKTDAYHTVYQHDPLGMVSSIYQRFLDDSRPSTYWVANRYTAKDGEELLTSVGVYVWDALTTVKIKVDTSIAPSETVPKHSDLDFVTVKENPAGFVSDNNTSITFSNPGFYMIDLATPIALNGTFDVIINILKENGSVPVEAQILKNPENQNSQDFTANMEVNAGESFWGTVYADKDTFLESYRGQDLQTHSGWEDLCNGGQGFNACIKAYTSTAVEPDSLELIGQQADNANTFTVTVNKNSSEYGDASLLVAIYDTSNTLIFAKVTDLNLASQDSFTSDAISFGADAAYYKAYLWNSTEAIVPLCQPLDKQTLTYHADF